MKPDIACAAPGAQCGLALISLYGKDFNMVAAPSTGERYEELWLKGTFRFITKWLVEFTD